MTKYIRYFLHISFKRIHVKNNYRVLVKLLAFRRIQ